MAVVSLQRPDDRSGIMFLGVLSDLRKRRGRLPRADRRPADATVVWVAGEHDPDDPDEAPVQSATAEVGDYRLLAVEMRDTFMLGMPLYMPQITWSIYEEDGDSSVALGGAAAPTSEDAKLRAEMALRVQLGLGLDG